MSFTTILGTQSVIQGLYKGNVMVGKGRGVKIRETKPRESNFQSISSASKEWK